MTMNSRKNKLFVLSKNQQQYLDLLSQAEFADLEITEDKQQATILLAAPPMIASQIHEYPNLKWMQSIYAGVDALMVKGLRRDYQLTNVKGIFGQQISEYVLGYTIAHFRHFDLYKSQQQQQNWKPHPYSTLNTKTLTILGTGAIGSHLAQSAKALGLKVLGINSSGIPPKDGAFDATFHIEEKNSVFEQSDIIVSTLPNTPRTKGLLNKESLSHCKQALLFNVGRGEVVEADGLIAALEAGSIDHAYLDVFINEPISQECLYWNHPDVTVTPHIAAHSFPEQVIEIFIENYANWRDGFKLKNLVDFNRGY